MDIETLRHFLLYATLINFGILLVWFLALAAAGDWIIRLHGRWFRLSESQLHAIHYGGIAAFKLGVILFNATPCIALWIVG